MAKIKVERKRRMLQIAAGALAFLMLVGTVASAAFAEERVSGYNLEDNVIEFNEVQDLVGKYSILAKMEDSLVQNMTSGFDDVNAAYRDTYRDTKDQFDSAIDDLKDQRDNVTDTDVKKMLDEQIHEMKRARDTALNDIEDEQDKISDQKDAAVRAIANGSIYNGKKSMTYGMQTAIFSYKNLELTQKLLNQQVQWYQTQYDKLVKQQALGAATALDVQGAKLNLTGAQNNLDQVNQGLDAIRRTVGVNLGWNAHTYQNITFGDLPVYDLGYADTRNLEADIKSAMQQNYAYGQALRIKDKNFTRWDKKEITIASTEQEIRISMTNLLATVRQKQTEYQNAETSKELARLKKERADRMDAAGLVGRSDYEALQLDYINKANAVETARMAYHQAVFNYESAVNLGIMTLGT
jgi:hypothetical protein